MGEVTAQAENKIRELITSGEFAPGDKLPFERTLVDDLGVSRTTIRLILTRLVAEGLVTASHGRGYFVSEAEA